jgi:ribonuclease P protein component
MKGREWRSASFLALVMPVQGTKSDGRARMGMIVSAKIGKAVIRKRASRVLRAAFAQVQPELEGKEVVFIARPVLKHKTSTEVAEELRRMVRLSK